MTSFKRKGEKTAYDFRAPECIGLKCWAPGMFQHRSPMSCGGSRNTGSPDTACCMNRAYRGCPHPLPSFDATLETSRKTEGWRKS